MGTGKATPPVGCIVLDSSCWLEYFSNSTNAGLYADPIANTHELIVPIITIYEV